MTEQEGARLRARGIRKSYGGVHALKDVSITLAPGRVHALLGENGAGKSTLVNILSGTIRPDDGDIQVDGQTVQLGGPQAAQRLGIRTVHQELELAGPLATAENIYLGRLPRKGPVVSFSRLASDTVRVLRTLGSEIGPQARVDALPVAEQQVVEIARALSAHPAVLILDEPTAALPPREIDQLLERIRALAASGVAVLYISHRLDEVMQVSDDVTVLRDGRVALHAPVTGLTKADVVRAMLGVDVGAFAAPEARDFGNVAVSVRGLSAPGARLEELDLVVGQEEIVGVFGLPGSGHDAVASALYGTLPATAGQVDLLGASKLPSSPRDAIARGIGLVPADRKNEGLALKLSVLENLMMVLQPRHAGGVLVDRKRARSLANALADDYRIKIADLSAPVGSLSGGNQQKVVLARWAATGAVRLLLLCEPTRGVDVGAKTEIHRLLRSQAAAGTPALLVSSDPEETIALCDRIYVVHAGRVAAEFAAGQATPALLTAAAL
ncbi:sugar ABC transporter ATP-binding protein [Microbacterium sp. LWH7-1.2]|jgi:ABC-type sugar transport system ATPase subunit|uniref:sugar ABC transporter ATP-binding protein n=1 Tax=Microbacterium sp. LWH7-1.2 TaxID=3135257 RepID=UPI0031393802